MTTRTTAPLPLLAGLLAIATFTGCAGMRPAWFPGAEAEPVDPAVAEAQAARELAERRERERAAVPPSPLDVPPQGRASTDVWNRAAKTNGRRVVVSIRERALWLMDDTTTIMRARIAVGMNDGFTYEGRDYFFETPVGVRKVLRKAPDPLWVPPDWHYLEKVVERGLVPVHVKEGRKYTLGDDTWIEIRGEQVGRVNHFGNFAPFTPGTEIIFDGKIYIPPFGTAQRRIPGILGTHKLEIGDGYLIHGTPEEDSIGEAVSHGCVRMYNDDVAQLYDLVPVGTPVFLY